MAGLTVCVLTALRFGKSIYDVEKAPCYQRDRPKRSHCCQEFFLLWPQCPSTALDFNAEHLALPNTKNVRGSLLGILRMICPIDPTDGIVGPHAFVLPGFATRLGTQPVQDNPLNLFLFEIG